MDFNEGRLLQLHGEGVVPDELLLLYGISGDLPEINHYMGLTEQEKVEIWKSKLEKHFGPDFMSHSVLAGFIRNCAKCAHTQSVNWRKEGF